MDNYLNSIIQRLKSDQPITITNALNDIEEMKQANLITPEIVDFLYPRLAPFLTHNNYKIRLIAFDLESYFLAKFCDYVYDSNVAFPNVISSLSSVNKKIVRLARECASVIMNIEFPSNWWPELDNKLTNSRSLNQKLMILDLLLEHTDEIHYSENNDSNIIPVESICKLLKDPKIQIQKKTMQILEHIQQEDLNSSLHAAEDHFRLLHPGEQEEPLSPKIKVEQRALRNRQRNRLNPLVQSQEDLLSQQSIHSHSSRRSQISATKSPNDYVNINNENISANYSSSHENSVASSRSRESRSSRNSRSSRASIISKQSKSSKMSQSNYTPQQQSNFEEKDSTEIKIQIKEEKPLEENVGFLPTQKTSTESFILKDLSTLQWQEKYKFLQDLDKLLQQPKKLQIPPDQLVDCVLTASFPISRQVAPLLSKILSELLSHNPELISLFKSDILTFILFGIRLLNETKPFQPLTDTLFLEGDPSEIVDAAVIIANNEKRSLHIESYFVSLFYNKERVTLERQALFNLLCYLVHKAYPESLQVADKQPEYLDDVTKLFHITSSHQHSLYMEFMELQTQKAKAILEQFVVNEQESTTRPYENLKGVINYENPIETVNKEFKKGEKSNLILIADALVQVDFCSIRRIEMVFLDLIKFLSVLSQGKVQRHINEIRRICAHFTSPQLLKIIEADNVVPDLIFGVAIFVWNCSKVVISGADVYYPRLYSIFKHASGDIREQVILIEMAISKASKKLFVDMDSIPFAHKKLILKIENQFMNSDENC